MNKRQKKKQITMIKRHMDRAVKRYWSHQPRTLYLPADDDTIELYMSMHLISPANVVVDQDMNPFIKIDLPAIQRRKRRKTVSKRLLRSMKRN